MNTKSKVLYTVPATETLSLVAVQETLQASSSQVGGQGANITVVDMTDDQYNDLF